MELPPPDELPEEVAKLGELRAVFRSARGVVVLCWALGVLALLLGLVVLAGTIQMLILGIGLWSAGFGLLRKAYRSGGLRVFVCADGLAPVRGTTVEVMRWGEINAVRRVRETEDRGHVLSSPAQLVVVGRGGGEFVFNETVSRLGDLRRLVEGHTLKLMLAPAVEAFESGAAIGFGDVHVSPAGLHCGPDTLPWDLFEHAEVSKGRLLLYGGNGRNLFGIVGVAQVPNVHVLLALAEHARAHHA
jgi:hypothetical protein